MRERKMAKMGLGDRYSPAQQAWKAAYALVHYYDWSDAVAASDDGPREYDRVQR